MRSSVLIILGSILAPQASWAAPPQCGPDCATPGRYVLCNDSFDTGTAGSGAVGLDSFEWVCSAFASPSASPFMLTGAYGAFAPTAGSNPTIFEVRVYRDAPGALPQGQLMPEQAGNVQVTASAAPMFYSLPLSPTYSLNGAFRFCLLNGLDGADMGILYDGSGIQAAKNFALQQRGMWQDATVAGVPGDFVLRAVVTTADMTPWQAGGACSRADGGVPDATPAGDATPVGVDASPDDDAAPSADDAAPSGDALPSAADALPISADASPSGSDAAPSDAASASDAGIAGPAPTITTVSPNSGSNALATAVTVLGNGFVTGATLRIGEISASAVQVAGATTLSAQVPPGIAAGQYDVKVTNPDGQTAIKLKGYTSIDPNGGAVVDDGCNCASAPADASLLVLMLSIVALRRRPR